MAKLQEIFPGDNGLWAIISKSFGGEYTSIFGKVPPSHLDYYNVFKYGDKIVLDTFYSDNRDEAVIGLASILIEDWVTATEALKVKYAITELVDVETTETASTNDNIYSGTSLGGNKRFDDANIVDDTRTTDNNTTNIKGTTTTKRTSTKQLSDTRKRSLEVFYDKLEHLHLQINKQLINIITLKLWK